MSLTPSLTLFISSIFGAYAGFLLGLQVSHWFVMTFSMMLLALFNCPRFLRALAVSLCALSVAAALARHHLDERNVKESRIPTEDAFLTGVIEEVSPTLLDGKKVRFLADSGFRLMVHLTAGAAQIPIDSGDRIRLFGKVKRLQHAMALGTFDAYWFSLAKNYEGRLSIHNPFRIRILQKQHASYFWADLRAQLRNRLIGQLTPRESSVLLALMIGETDFFENEQKQIYQVVGAGHLLAVSGLQVTCLSFLFFYFFRWLLLLIPWVGRLSKARVPAVMLTLLAVWAFVGLSGASASAVRSAAMSSLVLLGFLLKRESSMADGFGVAGFLTVVLSPVCVFDPSFLFSYLAIFGILLSGSLMAGVITLPLSAYYFGAIALGGLLANLALIPIAVFLQTPAILLAVIGFEHWGAYLAGMLEASCEALGDYLGGLLWLPSPTAWQTAGLILACILLSKKKHVSAAVLCGFLILPDWLLEQKSEGIHGTVLAVGQGDASVFEFPTGQVLVVDGGPREYELLNFLRRRWIKKIDVLVLSHPDLDHINGLFAVLENLEVSEIWHSGFTEEHPLMRKLLRLAMEKKIVLKQAEQILGVHKLGLSQIEVLGPAGFDPSETTNNNSLILKICFEKNCALWPGDIESKQEQIATSAWKADLLKAPHHGSKSSSSEHLVSQVDPKHVIFCTQAENQFGFPHEIVKTRWKAAGVKTWDTGSQGEINFKLTGKEVLIQSYRQGS